MSLSLPWDIHFKCLRMFMGKGDTDKKFIHIAVLNFTLSINHTNKGGTVCLLVLGKNSDENNILAWFYSMP